MILILTRCKRIGLKRDLKQQVLVFFGQRNCQKTSFLVMTGNSQALAHYIIRKRSPRINTLTSLSSLLWLRKQHLWEKLSLISPTLSLLNILISHLWRGMRYRRKIIVFVSLWLRILERCILNNLKKRQLQWKSCRRKAWQSLIKFES